MGADEGQDARKHGVWELLEEIYSVGGQRRRVAVHAEVLLITDSVPRTTLALGAPAKSAQ